MITIQSYYFSSRRAIHYLYSIITIKKSTNKEFLEDKKLFCTVSKVNHMEKYCIKRLNHLLIPVELGVIVLTSNFNLFYIKGLIPIICFIFRIIYVWNLYIVPVQKFRHIILITYDRPLQKLNYQCQASIHSN